MSKSMKKKNSNAMFNRLVNNKITLYVVAIIALISLLGHIMTSEFSAIVLFFLAGGIAYSFTKNMTIVLGSAVIVTNVATMSRSFFVYQEGFNDPSNNKIPLDEKVPLDDEVSSTKKVSSGKKSLSTDNEVSSDKDSSEALTQTYSL